MAREIGIIDDITNYDKVTISGQEVRNHGYHVVTQKVDCIRIYSRVSPEHKLKIIRALKNKGHIVIMTGDGINDAPALKKELILALQWE